MFNTRFSRFCGTISTTYLIGNLALRNVICLTISSVKFLENKKASLSLSKQLQLLSKTIKKKKKNVRDTCRYGRKKEENIAEPDYTKHINQSLRSYKTSSTTTKLQTNDCCPLRLLYEVIFNDWPMVPEAGENGRLRASPEARAEKKPGWQRHDLSLFAPRWVRVNPGPKAH